MNKEIVNFYLIHHNHRREQALSRNYCGILTAITIQSGKLLRRKSELLWQLMQWQQHSIVSANLGLMQNRRSVYFHLWITQKRLVNQDILYLTSMAISYQR